MNTILFVDQLITPYEMIPDGAIIWDDNNQIIFCGEKDRMPRISGKTIRKENSIAVPGFIDIHTHGGFGITFCLGDLESDLNAYSKKVTRFGVTGFIITITGPTSPDILRSIQAYVPLLERRYKGAQPLGLHLEGPFLNPEKAGAYNSEWLQPPSMEEMRSFVDAGNGWIKHVTLAPELDHAFEIAEFLKNHNIDAALGHSNTDYKLAQKALAGPFTHITHTYNAQSSFHHRAPGVIGAILTSESATAELIADGYHVHPAAMQIAIKCLGSDRICLITDAMPGTGLPDGTYDLLGQIATVKNGVAKLADGTFAGSTATMDACIRNIVKEVKLPLIQAIRMSSINPARIIGVDDQSGDLSKGKQADIVLLNRELKVTTTIKNGEFVFPE